jgi:hypothetical protein
MRYAISQNGPHEKATQSHNGEYRTGKLNKERSYSTENVHGGLTI